MRYLLTCFWYLSGSLVVTVFTHDWHTFVAFALSAIGISLIFACQNRSSNEDAQDAQGYFIELTNKGGPSEARFCISCSRKIDSSWDWCPSPCDTDLRDSNNRML